VYALTPEDAETSNDVVTSTLLIASHSSTVLFDSNETYLFVSCYFSRNCGLGSEWMDVHLAVATLIGKIVVCTFIVKSCPISMQAHIMPANRVVIEMSGFDVILGQDWLSIYHACVDFYCTRKNYNLAILFFFFKKT
jgi:hypothetical protein